MQIMFAGATSFNGEISKWDVSRVTDVHSMFKSAAAFDIDIAKWRVSRVRNMNHMFWMAILFNQDLSPWDVRSVNNMNYMFSFAKSFDQQLCGSAWVHSNASMRNMFEGSSGSISQQVCIRTQSNVKKYSPLSNAELKRAVRRCLSLSPEGVCVCVCE